MSLQFNNLIEKWLRSENYLKKGVKKQLKMYETKSDMGSDAELNNYSIQSNVEPKNMQELSSYVNFINYNYYIFIKTLYKYFFRHKIFCKMFKINFKQCLNKYFFA